MDISSNSLNQPVSFYQKNTGNTINMAIESENKQYASNIFMGEHALRENIKQISLHPKKKRKNKRLNTMDNDYFPDEPIAENVNNTEVNNSFIENKKEYIINRIKKSLSQFAAATPLINYFFLKQQTKKIQKTVAELNNITQNVDDMLNSAVPYGEEKALYTDIAQNLTNAANIIGKVNKEIDSSKRLKN